MREAANIVAEGIATADDVDTVAKNGFGLRMPAYGILEHQDIVGLGLGLGVVDYVARDLYNEPRAPEYFRELVRRGAMAETILALVDNSATHRAEEYVAGKGMLPGPTADGYLDFLERDVIPFVETGFRTLPGPAGRAIGGSSYGGILSLYAGWTRPHTWGRGLAMSPAFDYDLFSRVEREAPPEPSFHPWTVNTAVILLFVAVVLGSFESYVLVQTITPLISTFNLTQTFVGLVLIAILTNLPENVTAVGFARRNNMTLSLEIGMSSALQIALFVVPVLVLLSTALTGTPLDMVFSPFALIALLFTVMIANFVSADGICHWLEGVQLIAVYILMAIGFYFI